MNDLLARHGVEVAHHFSEGDGVYAKETRIPAGVSLTQHMHPYGHKSILAQGSVVLGGERLDAPACVTLPANVAHEVRAVTDAVWYCIHPTEDQNPDTIDTTLIGKHIRLVDSGLPVAPIYWALQQRPHLWNEHKARTADPASPHHGLDDIWARYGDPARADDGLPHDCHWYPSADALGVKQMCLNVMHMVGGTELGGVLITRIPPGKMCRPHVDPGWHARRYEKFAVQIASAPGQRFCFAGEALETKPGDVFWFNNGAEHWVTNDTQYERVTMIVCVRKES